MIELTVQTLLTNLRWSSDWNGEDVGFDDVPVVGLYTQERDDGDYSFYIDMETNDLLDFWKDDLED